MANKIIPEPLWKAAKVLCPVANNPEPASQTICVRMSSREYYSGNLEMTLPLGITQDDISSVEPEGYGEFGIYLNDSGVAKVDHIEAKKVHDWSHIAWANIDDDWKLGVYGGTTFIMPQYEAHMEFCEVDENMIDDWEVTDG